MAALLVGDADPLALDEHPEALFLNDNAAVGLGLAQARHCRGHVRLSVSR